MTDAVTYALRSEYIRGIEVGIANERATIVKHVRTMAGVYSDPYVASQIEEVARAIERGDHAA